MLLWGVGTLSSAGPFFFLQYLLMILLNATQQPPLDGRTEPGETSFYADPRPKLGGDFLAYTKAAVYNDVWIKMLKEHYKGDPHYERSGLFLFHEAPPAADHISLATAAKREKTTQDVVRWLRLMSSMIRCMAHWTLDYAVRDFTWQDHHLLHNVMWEPDHDQTFRGHLVHGDVIGLYGMPEYDESNELCVLLNKLVGARAREVYKPKMTLWIGPAESYPACRTLMGLSAVTVNPNVQPEFETAIDVGSDEDLADDIEGLVNGRR